MNVPRKPVLYVDNCSSHVEDMSTLGKLKHINMELRKFRAQETYQVQSADLFVI